MRELPIIFNEWSIKRILDGRKTVTRRVVKPQPDILGNIETAYVEAHITSSIGLSQCPYGQPGDVLYARETWWQVGKWSGYTTVNGDWHNDGWRGTDIILFEEPDDVHDLSGIDKSGHFISQQSYWRKRPSIHLFKKYARIWLRNTGVRAERVQDITEEDAIAEGCIPQPDDCELCQRGVCSRHQPPVGQFATLWDDINGHRDGCAWSDNPFVWVIAFNVLSTDGKPELERLEAQRE